MRIDSPLLPAARPMSPKELYRRLEELTSRVFEDADGPAAVQQLAERIVSEHGAEFGLRAVRRVESSESAPVPDAPGFQTLRLEAFRRPCALQFEVSTEAPPERVELVLSALSSILSTKLLERAFGSAMRQAEEIQRSLLPQSPPAFEGFEIAARAVPAEEVGGDLHDFLELEEETLGLVIGDASGHGLPAALLVRDVVVGLRMGMEKDFKPGHALARLNRVIHSSALSSCFVSVFYAELERNGNLFYFNAGHERPLLFAGGERAVLAHGDTVIGPLAQARFKRHFAHVDHGATLVLHTDGLVERRAASGAHFGVERLAGAVAAHLERPVSEIVARVFEEAHAHGGESLWEDDATLVVVRRLP